jgi:glycosyltransferase involved in cell wall biosynthesis
MKKVCFFGIYDPEYARNRVLMSGFRKNGYEVVECQADPRKFFGLKKYFELYRQYKKIRNNKFEFIIVAFPGQSVVWLARLLFGNRIIFDAFLSLYSSNVFDRKLYSAKSFNGIKDYLMDVFGSKLATKVLLNTDESIQYFVDTFKIPKNKFIMVSVGTDDELLFPDENTPKTYEGFMVHFHGSFIPIQGVEYIIRAAKILEKDKSIHFRIIGTGQDYDRVMSIVKELNITNVEFIDRVPYADLHKWISNADISLGLLGDIDRIDQEIPNKVFESMACKRAFITADTTVARRMFVNGENAMLCKRGDENDLAEKILLLKNNKALKDKIAENSYKLFSENFTPRVIASDLIKDLGSRQS